MRDHLTGLFNRRYMEETLERELLRAARKQIGLGIIMLDVDGFKGFNDTYGHAVGDAILQKLGNLLLGYVRGEDIACRYGGDEFIIVMPDSSRNVTYTRAELICEYARKFRLQYEELSLEPVTLSLGVAIFPEDGETSASILRAADNALYRAKHAGSSQVVVAN